MDIDSKIKKGAKITLTIGLTPGGVRHIRIVADSIESRDHAITAVRRALPALETFENLLTPPISEAIGGESAGSI